MPVEQPRFIDLGGPKESPQLLEQLSQATQAVRIEDIEYGSGSGLCEQIAPHTFKVFDNTHDIHEYLRFGPVIGLGEASTHPLPILPQRFDKVKEAVAEDVDEMTELVAINGEDSENLWREFIRLGVEGSRKIARNGMADLVSQLEGGMVGFTEVDATAFAQFYKYMRELVVPLRQEDTEGSENLWFDPVRVANWKLSLEQRLELTEAFTTLSTQENFDDRETLIGAIEVIQKVGL